YLGDRDGVRTPFQWHPDRNAGFSKSSPQQLFLPVTIEPEYHYETVNVEIQQKNPNSHLWWMKNLIALKKRHPALNYGSLRLLQGGNSKIFSFIRENGEQAVLCVANLSRTAQCVELNLSDYKSEKPVELFGSSEFPPIGELPYFL